MSDYYLGDKVKINGPAPLAELEADGIDSKPSGRRSKAKKKETVIDMPESNCKFCIKKLF